MADDLELQLTKYQLKEWREIIINEFSKHLEEGWASTDEMTESLFMKLQVQLNQAKDKYG